MILISLEIKTQARRDNMPQETTQQGVSNSNENSPTYKLKLKVNGEEVVKEFTQDELVAHVQKGLSADEKFQIAASQRKEVEEKERILSEKERELMEKDQELRAMLDAIIDGDENVPSEPSDNEINDIVGNDPAILAEINALKAKLQQNEQELSLLRKDAIYKDIKEEREALMNKYGLSVNEANDVAKYALEKGGNISLEEAFRILFFDKEKPVKMTPEVSSGKMTQDKVNALKKALIDL